MVLRRQPVHRFYKYAGVFRIHILMDAMTEVEDMALSLTKAGQYGRDFFFNTARRRIEHGRVHIALQRHFVTDAAARIGDIGGPVETQRITAGFGHRFQPLSAAFGE